MSYGERGANRSGTLLGCQPKGGAVYGGLLWQAIDQIFGQAKKTASTIEQVSLQIYDVHLEYVKDFGRNLLANLDASEKDVQFREELDIDLTTVEDV